MSSIAVIGAGLAGLTACALLKEAGHDVVVLDKGRGLGGRMATRRLGALSFDHGAQFFTARSPRFRALVGHWTARGVAAPWHGDRYVGMPGMSAPARLLADGIAVLGSCEVAGLERGGRGWTVHCKYNSMDVPGNGAFDAIVLAIPAPQALPLAGRSLEPALARVRFAPCWALMLAGEVAMEDSHLTPDDPVVAWIADTASKPQRNKQQPAIVVHARGQWSRDNLEIEREEAAGLLMANVRRLMPRLGAPSTVMAHRWRYALVEQVATRPCLWDGTRRIGACGDWCIGPRVEAAFLSGEAMAREVIAGLAAS